MHSRGMCMWVILLAPKMFPPSKHLCRVDKMCRVFFFSLIRDLIYLKLKYIRAAIPKHKNAVFGLNSEMKFFCPSKLALCNFILLTEQVHMNLRRSWVHGLKYIPLILKYYT